MSRMTKDKMKLAAELIRRGATMLGESCQTCGGFQVRYKGRNYCIEHEDITAVLLAEEVSYESVVTSIRSVLLSKIVQAISALEKESDVVREEQLVTFLIKCVDLLHRLPEEK